MAIRNAVETVKFQISLDRVSNSLLQRMGTVGIFGKNRAEVTAWIVHEWIWHNQEKLDQVGISLRAATSNPRKLS
jgi:hypothetical protein